MEKIGLVRIMKDYLDESNKWPRFTYGDLFGSSMLYVYHNTIILAFLCDNSVIVRGEGHHYGYCGTFVPAFDRYIPEDPEFIPRVSNAIDIGIRLIDDGRPWHVINRETCS